MPLPWLQDVDPAERLPDETKWEDHDELTLWKQCKLRGLDDKVKKDGDALQLLNALKNFEVEWACFARGKNSEISLPDNLVQGKALESAIRYIKRQTFQVIRVEERDMPDGSMSEMVIEISDATVRLGGDRKCNCGFRFLDGPRSCTHILYLELYILRCPRRLQLLRYFDSDDLTEYFANAPPAFKPQKLSRDRNLNNPISDKDCHICFKEAKVSDDITRCEVCRRVAHQQCHVIYRTRKGACEGNTGCPLCCPQCPWNPSNQELKAELVPMEVKKEPGMPRDRSATAEDAVFSATKQKVSRLEKKVRKLRDQLRGQRRRKPTSRTMTDRQYRRLVAKTGRRIENHRNNKGTMRQTNSPQKEEACVKEERQADVSGEPTTPVDQTVKEEKSVKIEEESGPTVEIVKVEPRRKVKSEPVVISLL